MSRKSPERTLYLLDAMALAYRAHFVFINRPLINSKGLNTSAAYGFTAALLKLIEDLDIGHIVVVFDAMGPGGTFRDEMYADYKAHRDPPPEDLIANLPIIKEIVLAMDIPVMEHEGVEADDVIGTLARRAEAEHAKAVIVSPDKDFQQLLSEQITMFRPAYRGDGFNPVTVETFRERWGVDPIRFIDILALMGDASDNVPGVPGIGEKTAKKLIQEYGSVEALLEHADDISGKRAREGLQNHADDARLSKALVTIKTDVDVAFDWKRFARSQPDFGRLADLFRRLEINTMADRAMRLLGATKKAEPEPATNGQGDLFSSGAAKAAEAASEVVDITEDLSHDPDAVEYTLVRSRAALDRLVAELANKPRLSFDTETTSTDPMLASLVGVSLAWASGEAAYVPTPMPDGTSTESVIDALRPILSDDRPKIGQHIKYDITVLARHGLEVRGPLFDTMVAHYLVAPEDPHGLDALALRYLDYRMIPISSLIGTGRDQKSMRDVSIEDAAPYACEDADIAWRLAELLQPQLEEAGLTRIAEEMEFPLTYVLADMERTGIRVEASVLSDIARVVDSELAELEGQVYEAAGGEFNIASTQQLGEILFEKLGLRVVSKTSKGKPSTREDVLQVLATEHPLPGLILDWRELSKLKSTYVDTLAGLIHPETGRIHTSYNQTVAATGRLSSSNPNLQNIPVRTARGREIRRAFVPERGWKLLSSDYAQIELRILASLSKDKPLCQAFRDGEDIHSATAARVFGIPLKEVDRDQRRKAKEVNYGIPYGVSAFGLAQRLRCSRTEAQALIDGYQKSYPGVSTFLAMQVELARERGYAETKLGRRRYVPDIGSRNWNVRGAQERIAVNMPIQGTQADMIKIAMIRIHQRLKDEGFRARMLLQVHDELVFEAPPDELPRLEVVVRTEMAAALPLDVPVEVGLDTGDNWLDAH